MTSRHRRFFAGLPVLVLAPLLAAPRGCHFGDGDVPLGENATGGDAGMGGDDGTSGSSGSGGSANGGFAGTATGGFAGTATGGNAGSGGVGPQDGPCLETLSPFGWDDTRGASVTASAVDRLLAGDHQAWINFPNRTAEDFTLALVGPRLYFVESERNPDFLLDIPVTCANHVRVIATARVFSSNGTLDETLPNFELNIGIPSAGADPLDIAANASATIEADRLRGTYSPAISATECFRALQFDLTRSRAGFNGSLIETIGSVPCGVNDANSSVTGRSAAIIHCDGDCRTEPNDAIVVEAESCDGLGVQLTHAGDESTFTRSDALLTREESWGCGCATRSEFVMAWSPRSPLELRLCHDDGADGCEAACSGALSHDLTTAFRAAGTNEYSFAD